MNELRQDARYSLCQGLGYCYSHDRRLGYLTLTIEFYFTFGTRYLYILKKDLQTHEVDVYSNQERWL